jgi:hypothetical protein
VSQLLEVEGSQTVTEVLQRACRVQLLQELLLHGVLKNWHQERPEVKSYSTKAEKRKGVFERVFCHLFLTYNMLKRKDRISIALSTNLCLNDAKTFTSTQFSVRT